MFFFIASARLPTTRRLRVASRALSSQTECAVEKLRCAFEEYRLRNYTQEMPTRFKKEIVLAASTGNEDVKVIGLQKVLSNIGASRAISVDEMQAIFAEMGNASGAIPAKKMIQLL